MTDKTPYSDKEASNTTDLKVLLDSGYRMDRPSDCPPAMCVFTPQIFSLDLNNYNCYVSEGCQIKTQFLSCCNRHLYVELDGVMDGKVCFISLYPPRLSFFT